MKKINFKKLYIQNFLSIGNEPVELNFNNGVNVISGINRDENDIANAAGKSTIQDAFYFALFGNTMRELTKLSFIVNRKNGKNCIVRLEADIETSTGKDNYLIERKLAPQSLKIWKNSIEVTKSTTAETNNYIDELFYTNKDIFQNCILMRANNTIPFMARKKQEKKNFIETIFNLNIFSAMSRLLKDDIRAVKSEYSLEQNTLNLHQNNIENYKNELERLILLQTEYETHRQEEINNFNLKIDEEKFKLKQFITEKEQLISNFNDNEKQLIQDEITRWSDFIKNLKQMKSSLMIDEGVYHREIKKLENSPEACPTCKRVFSEEHINALKEEKAKLGEKLNETASQIEILVAKIKEVEAFYDNANTKMGIFKEHERSLETLNIKINECKRIISLYLEQIDKKAEKQDISGINNFKNLIVNTEKTLKNVREAVIKLEKELAKMNVCEHILGEYGVRAYIVNQLLELFNNRIMYYLSAIKSTFSFRFNEYFEEEIKDSNGVLCLYNNCSGAEMKKIDLAISFAINDMLNLQHQITYNVIFFDEILDSSLDDKSLNIVLDFISEHCHKENKAIYIISHKSGAQIPFINEVITLEKVNGFTKRIIN